MLDNCFLLFSLVSYDSSRHPLMVVIEITLFSLVNYESYHTHSLR